MALRVWLLVRPPTGSALSCAIRLGSVSSPSRMFSVHTVRRALASTHGAPLRLVGEGSALARTVQRCFSGLRKHKASIPSLVTEDKLVFACERDRFFQLMAVACISQTVFWLFVGALCRSARHCSPASH